MGRLIETSFLRSRALAVSTCWLIAATAAGTGSWSREARMTAETVRVLIEDMSTPNAIRPHGIEGAGWAGKPRIGMGDTWPEGWTCALMWGQIYLASEGNPATNVRVAIREPSYWILGRKSGAWTRVQHTIQPEGAAYREDFVPYASAWRSVSRSFRE